MLKALWIASLYAIAMFCIWAALEIAPDMKWPVTDTEWLAANLLVIGMVAKIAGHLVLATASRRRYAY